LACFEYLLNNRDYAELIFDYLVEEETNKYDDLSIGCPFQEVDP
jgi:hypothetical protein